MRILGSIIWIGISLSLILMNYKSLSVSIAHDKKWTNEGKIELDKLNSKLKDFNILPLHLIA